MGKKKKSKKTASKKQKQQQPSGQINILGTDVGKLGTALAGVVAGEIAQVVIAKIVESTRNSGKLSDISSSLQEATTTAKQAAVEGTPSVEGAVDVVKEVAEALKPAVAKVIEIVSDRIDATTNSVETVATDSLNHAQASVAHHPIQGGVEDLKPVMTNVIDVVGDRASKTKQNFEDTALDTIDAAKKALEKAKSGKKKSKKS
ncbi:hypothetical protein [Pantanalinema sp. GBBB05]|uniref:hypothetical protein n=1 Tax=Pantanalinema sp. GBBB05 TaxID=2604139 RepID=UPI001DC0B0A8|nr:hypothetical protein [Pantanalinema sp. GBBB05]